MITLAPAKPSDVEAIALLLAQLNEYYGGEREEPSSQSHREIHDAVFGPPPSANVLLAWDEEKLVGFASYSFLWPAAGFTRSMYLKELYVVEASRHQGVGGLLMSELCGIALNSGCSRLEWMADNDNPPALSFYETTLGVAPDLTKRFYRLSGEAMAQMAGRRAVRPLG